MSAPAPPGVPEIPEVPGVPVLRVLVVEDEQVAGEAHVAYVERTPGFAVAGWARSAVEAVRIAGAARDEGRPVDLLVLDLHLPDGHGLGLLQRLRAQGHLCDAIAVTAARDAEVVRHAVAQGVVLYLLKPFAQPAFRAKLEQYAAYREAWARTASGEVAQTEVDALLATLRPGRDAQRAALPKGLSPETMERIVTVLRAADRPLSATEAAELIGGSRVTARRYLEALADAGRVVRRPRLGTAGRPELEYEWR